MSTALAIDLKKVTSVDEMQRIINIHLRDHRTGLPRGNAGAMLYLTETEPPTQITLPATQITRPAAQTTLPATQATGGKVTCNQASIPSTDESLNATTKGGKKGDAGRKGYGQC